MTVKTYLRTPLLTSGWIALAAVVAACDAGGKVVVEPLPPLTQPSAEARLGLPELAGQWRFAGWVLPSADTALARGGGLTPGGELVVETQRLDSIAGVYRGPFGRYPVIGEVRRDSVFTVVGTDAGGQARVLAGHLERDTLWLELTTFSVADAWPFGTRAAFVRTVAADSAALAAAPPHYFVRGPGGLDLLPPPPPPVDTLAPGPLAPDTTAPLPGAAPSTPQAQPQPRPERTPILTPPSSAETPAPREPRREAPPRRDTTARDTTRIPTPRPHMESTRPDTLVRPPPGPEVGLPPGE